MNNIPYLEDLRSQLLAASRRSASRVHRRRLIIVLGTAILGLLVVGSVAMSDLRWPLPDDVPPGTEPVQKGPTASVATGTLNGEGWILTARHVDVGDICVGIQYGPGWGEGCGFPPADQRPVQLQIDGGEDATFIYGHVRGDIIRVAIHLADGSTISESTIEQESYDVRFYVYAVDRSVTVKRVVGFDAEGRKVGTAT